MSGLQGGVIPGDGEKVKGGCGVSGHPGSGTTRALCELHGDTKVIEIRVQFG